MGFLSFLGILFLIILGVVLPRLVIGIILGIFIHPLLGIIVGFFGLIMDCECLDKM